MPRAYLQLFAIAQILLSPAILATASPWTPEEPPPGPCTATESYRWPNGERADISADTEFAESGTSTLNRAAESLKGELLRCARNANEPIPRTVVLRFEVDADGKTARAKIASRIHRKLRTCALASITHVRIPHHHPQNPTDPIAVVCRFEFRPTVSF